MGATLSILLDRHTLNGGLRRIAILPHRLGFSRLTHPTRKHIFSRVGPLQARCLCYAKSDRTYLVCPDRHSFKALTKSKLQVLKLGVIKTGKYSRRLNPKGESPNNAL
ncbi:hypothetical protein ACOKW7_10865 [Limnospira platensis CENA597]|uniref:hypothetical protein n=1 Tax=Limnospira platensis TaxID=118562 RepID=UPI003DA016CB